MLFRLEGKYIQENMKREFSDIQNMSNGISTFELKCPECELSYYRYDTFSTLPLDIGDEDTDLTSCLEKYSEENTLDEDNKWRCGNCKNKV